MALSTRRTFLKGCSAAIAGMSGAKLHSVVLGNDGNSEEILITIFLRGGCDVLNLIPPIGGADRAHYERERSTINVPADEALPLGTTEFGLHPSASHLHTLFGDNKMAIVQATGLNNGTRSHFDAMSYMELGTPGKKTTSTGWLTRHMMTATDLPESIFMPVVGMGTALPQSLQGSNEAVAMRTAGGLNWLGPNTWRDAQRSAVRQLYTGEGLLQSVGQRALDTLDIVDAYVATEYIPSGTTPYRVNDGFSNQLKTVAQLIKSGIGVRMATVDLGGWDTHDGQGTGSGGYFGTLVERLSQGLAAFYDDLNTSQADAPINRVTVVVMSEFGRRLRQNADNGTDHGHGGAMLVLGGGVNGGMYGTWPGLGDDQLYDNNDVAITTDYRQVLSEILVRRHCNPEIGSIFPNYSDYTPLGIVQGEDLIPNYVNTLDEAEVPLAAGLNKQLVTARTNGHALAIGAAGLAVSAGLVALRNRQHSL